MFRENNFRDISLHGALGINKKSTVRKSPSSFISVGSAILCLPPQEDFPGDSMGSLEIKIGDDSMKVGRYSYVTPPEELNGWTEDRHFRIFPDMNAPIYPVLKKDRAILVMFDLESCLKDLVCEPFEFARTPLYVKLGISPAKIPNGLRRTLSNLRRRLKPSGSPTVYDGLTWLPKLEQLRQTLFMDIGGDHPRFREKSPLLLRHDIDTDWCLQNGFYKKLMQLEARLGLRASWNFVTHLYDLPHDIIAEIQSEEHEIGYHGNYHDHKFGFLPLDRMKERYRQSESFVRRYGVTSMCLPSGKGSAQYYRNIPAFLNTTSNYNTSTYPIWLGNVLEIPYTHTDCYDQSSISPDEHLEHQILQADWLIDHGSILHIATHPEPGLTGDDELFGIFRDLLEHVLVMGDSVQPMLLSELTEEMVQRQ